MKGDKRIEIIAMIFAGLMVLTGFTIIWFSGLIDLYRQENPPRFYSSGTP